MARRPLASESLDSTPKGLRTMGSYTDILSMSSKSGRPALPYATPPPAYVSESEAEKLVYAEMERQVIISEGAIGLVNGFLDQVLYDILSRSHSTTLPAVRSAVPVVLKQRLGRSAVQAADEELQDYIPEDEMDEVLSAPATLDPKADFDNDLAWKLTRLRCMVYAKLGDMEEEDEEDYLEDFHLRDHIARVHESTRASAAITPAAAIFLSTVLEFLAEQALCIAAQHATKRHAASKDTNDATHHGLVLLEEIDMSGIGKEGPLIRLWRSWKGSMRSGGSGSSRPTTPSIMSPVSPDSPNYEWKFPAVPPFSTIQEEQSPLIKPRSSLSPADVPLPTNDNDVDELEVHGLARSADEEASSAARPTFDARRPSSMLIMPGKFPDPSTATTSDEIQRPTYGRKRSHSLPTSGPSLVAPRSRTEVGGRLSDQGASSSLEDLQEKVGGTTKPEARTTQQLDEQAMSSSRSGAESSTVAAIAGALSVEASRALRRDPSLSNQTSPVASAGAAQRGQGISSEEDDDQRASFAADHEGGSDPEDLALSLPDERDGPQNQTNPRDSGFGVAGAEDDLPIQGQQDHDIQEQTATYPDQVRHERDTMIVSTPGQDHFPQPPAANIYDDYDPYSTQNSARPHVRMNTSSRRQNEPVVAAVSAYNNRTTSLEHQERSPTAVRFPQHLPNSQHLPVTDHNQDRVPRYATSSTLGQSAHSRTTSAGRPSTAGDATARRQHIRLRSDDEKVEELEKAKKSLDVLIDSDETLHYTLTPKTAREGVKPKAKSQTQELADFFRNTAPPGEDPARPRSSRSAKESLGGLRSNPLSAQPPLPVNTQAASSIPGQQAVSSPSRPKNPLGEPRDPRMTRNNTRDLADYARSTGPEHEMQLPKALGTRPGTAQVAESTTSSDNMAENRPVTSPDKRANRLKFQARDARAPRTAESSDLIDFIREGPPRAPGDHRIDRRVAPFRSTMDSDDLNALVPPPELDTNGRKSDGSAVESAMTGKSMPSSMNSRTGLLESTNRSAGKATNGVASRQPIIPETDGIPKRNRRKVRDPYAIDFSDEEEEEMEEELFPPRRRTDEESLVDFLRNTAPGPGMSTQPILGATPGPSQAESPDTVKPQTSSSKLRDYLQGSGAGRNGISAGKSNGARAESPHLTQIGSKMDKYRPTQVTHAPHVERNRARMRAEPRDATLNNNSATADLAAYLMNSGPPPGSEAPVQKLGSHKDQAGFMRFFQRRGSVRK
ncbi:hypothetical protein LTR99_008837 [Exophiala xenobiotica]|uniref:Uncharacterized protein n=1 Tax=Vermiconidia calcicola TaxID=1690605 RepID=A0AAV9Q5B8_9PEZI|nr:hypothetical protein LTR96_009106 [Exophiala xenobiotica]KAK5533481.1 hypothetical protein LTR25_007347 [Vermiconidia calcicola]KAK5542942.1 hypothetical protein LTR23_005267 [Chaetothyriales sp. CCFEE 6169]KAK5296470.1 hypothetical protein LTR99_008837 [Exophiala xenobiotica]KAK5334523.1 hypothetical protein LTR98_009477 [Exophiala xenobiotica]